MTRERNLIIQEENLSRLLCFIYDLKQKMKRFVSLHDSRNLSIQKEKNNMIRSTIFMLRTGGMSYS